MKDKLDHYVFLSIAFHFMVIVLVWIGLPHVQNRLVHAERRIPVGIISVAELAKKPEPAKTVAAPAPPVSKPAEKKEPPKTPSPKTPPEKPKAAPKPKPKPEKKTVVAEAKKEEVKKPEAKKQEPKPEEDFTALLKDIAPPSKKKPEAQPAPVETPDPAASFARILEGFSEGTQTGQVNGNTLDMDAVLAWSSEVGNQFAKCWNIEPGAAGMRDIAVEVGVRVGGDLSIRQADIVDKARMGRDGVFRAAAERARRALLDARCNPLPKPPSGLDIVNETIILTFDPSEMF